MALRRVEAQFTNCVDLTTDSHVKVAENGIGAVFLNPDRKAIRRIKVDGCAVTVGPRCDWIVSSHEGVDVLVELKGTDVDHATEQIIRTLRFWANHPERDQTARLAALVVCSQYPRIDTKIQRAKKRMAVEFRTPLHIRTRNEEYRFETLATFTG